jgi:glycerophosphoryl diester phosphodiesterase
LCIPDRVHRVASTPIVVGHRGAPGYRPEHTLASYELAIRMGADFIEPDIVSTADGVLVARHDVGLATTTDIAAHSAIASPLVHDLTLAQLRALRATERMPELRPANLAYNGHFPVPTLDEILDLCVRLGAELGRRVGAYLTRFTDLGLPLGASLLATLEAAGLNTPDAPVIVESFEVGPLRELRGQLHVPISQLVEPGSAAEDMLTPDGLAEIATYAQGVSPHKDLVIRRDAAGRLDTPTPLVGHAHAVGLVVHCWTFRDEERFRPVGLDAAGEYTAFFDAGVDGVFSDQPDTAVAARRSWMMRA